MPDDRWAPSRAPSPWWRPRARGLAAACAILLVACAAEPPLEDLGPDGHATEPPGPLEDLDQDGYAAAQGDCDDADPAVHPFAPEGEDGDGDGTLEGDGQDDDCDGLVDEGTDAADDDHDGLSERQGDCDDHSARRFPGAAELCDGQDDDCDGHADDLPPGEPPCVAGLVRCQTVTDPGSRCQGDDDCRGGAWCAAGQCARSECDTLPGRARGQGIDPLLDGAFCEDDSDCAHGSYCEGGLCDAGCQEDGDCASGLCTPRGRCGECAADADCAPGDLCSEDGRCLAPQCEADADCQAGAWCDLDRQCVDASLAEEGEAPTVEWLRCPAEGEEEPLSVAGVVIPRGEAEAEVCFRLTGGTGSGRRALRMAALIPDSRTRPGATGPLLELDFADDPEATQDEATRTWTTHVGEGEIHHLFIARGDTTGLGPLGSSPTIRVAGGRAGADLRVHVPGPWGGALLGRLIHDGGSSPAETFGVLIQPGDEDAHPAILLKGSAPLQGVDLAGILEASPDEGAFTLSWWQVIDLPALAASLRDHDLTAPIDRPLYRRIVLEGDSDADGLEGTFTETLRGLAPGDVVRTGSFSLRPSAALARLHPEALGAAPGEAPPPWPQVQSFEAGFESASLSASPRLSPSCADHYRVGTGGLSVPRCLAEGDASDPRCPWDAAAYPLGPWLAGVAAEGEAAGDDYASLRFAADGVCEPELDLWSRTLPYEPGEVRPVAYSVSPGSEGALAGACAEEGATFTLGSEGFTPCCADANRLGCSAETYALVAATSAEVADRDAARRELLSPLAALVGGHAYTLQALRQAASNQELELSITGQPASFDQHARLSRQAAAVDRLMPVLSFLLSQPIAAALDQLGPEDVSRCREAGPCPYDPLMEALGGALTAHQEAMATLGESWYGGGRGDDLRFITAVTWLEGALADRLLALDPQGASPLPGRLRGLSERALIWQSLADRARTPWAYPLNWMPNVTSHSFEGLMDDARKKVNEAATWEAELITAWNDLKTSQAAQTASLTGRRDEIRRHLIGLCGLTSSLEPVPAQWCGMTRDGDLYEAMQELSDRLTDSDLAQAELDRQLQRITIKEGEAASTVDALTQLLQSYDTHQADLMAALDTIERDYLDGWTERFKTWQDEREDLYDQLREGYANLAAKLQAEREAINAQRVAVIEQRCAIASDRIKARKANAQATCDQKKADLVTHVQTRINEAREKTRGLVVLAALYMGQAISNVCAQTHGLFTCGGLDPVPATAIGLFLTQNPDQCDAECAARQAEITHCDMEIAELDQELQRATGECSLAQEEEATRARETLAKDLWQQERDQLDLMRGYDDAKLEQWYQYREGQMSYQAQRQEERAREARAHADASSGVTAQIGVATSAFTAELQMLMVDLSQRQEAAELAFAEVNGAAERAASLSSLASSLEAELADLDLRIANGDQDDPAFRVVETQEWLSLERGLDRAREAVWMAIRSYEVSTTARFADTPLVFSAMTSRQLCDVIRCLDDQEAAWRLSYGLLDEGRWRSFSARLGLGLDRDAVDPSTGLLIPAGERFGRYLADDAQRRAYGVHEGLSHWIQIQGEASPAGPGDTWDPEGDAVWDATRCNEQITSIQVAVICDHCTEEGSVALRLRPGNVAHSHGCEGGSLNPISGGGEPFPPILFDAPVILPPAAGGIVPTEVQWEAIRPSTAVVNLPAIFTHWEVDVAPPSAQPRNTSLKLAAVDDIVLRINYADQSPETWPGTQMGSALCAVETSTHYNPRYDYTCGD